MAVKMKSRDNLADVEADLDALQARILDTALPRATNALLDQVQVAGFRKINEIYQIPASTMNRYTTLKSSTPADLEANITVKGRGFPLSTFKPLQTSNGVAVTVKGRRFVIPHAFMVERFGSHVFARGAYGGKARNMKPSGETFGRFVFGRSRLPISELWSFAPPDCLANRDVTGAMDDRSAEQAPKILARELKAVARGF